MKRFQSFFGDARVFAVVFLWLIGYVAVNLWPASYWLQVNSVQVQDTLTNTQIIMVVDREVQRPFTGDWTATVRKVTATGLELTCSGAGRSNYRPTQDLPPLLTLDWWTGGACKTLAPGDYVVDTTWRIEPALPFVPHKHAKSTSNIFHICGNPDCPRRALLEAP